MQKNHWKALDVFHGSMTHDQAIQVLVLAAYIVKQDLVWVNNIDQLVNDQLVSSVQSFADLEGLDWFDARLLKIGSFQLRDVFKIFIELRNESAKVQDYGSNAFEFLKGVIFSTNSAEIFEHFDTGNGLVLFTTLVGNCKEQVVYDGACGGGLIVNALSAKKAVLRDINPISVGLSKILFSLSGHDAEIKAINTLQEDEYSHGVDLVVSTPPIGLRVNEQLVAGNKYLKDLHITAKIPTSAADSLWIQQSLFQLNNEGKAYLLMSIGWLFRGGYDAALREKLIELNWVEAVVLLPAGILGYANIETSLLILNKSKESNGIRLVDARNFGERPRSKLRLSVAHAEEIRDLITGKISNSAISKVVSIQEIISKKYSLHCSEYFAADISVEQLNFESELEILRTAQHEYMVAQEAFNQLIDKIGGD